MNIKQQTAAVSTLLNLALTLFKFVLFFITGSLVILAEAWHSLTDIFTSLLVYFSVHPRHDKNFPQTEETPERKENDSSSFLVRWRQISLEKRVSLFIGLFILAAAFGVIRKVIVTPPPAISFPLLYGLIFIAFSIGSYIVYKFEVRIGKEQNSSGLIADGLHSKADMVGSLLAGFSLILHQLGINVDKTAALIISILILSFAAETLINFWGALKGKTEWEDKAVAGMVTAAFEKSTWDNFFNRVAGKLKLGQPSPGAGRRLKNTLLCLLGLGALIVIISNCLFTVGPSEQAIRERLGRPVNRERPLEPGLHWKLPWPLEKVIKVNSRSIRSMNIGNITAPQAIALLWTREHGTEQSFLSGDNNFFYPYLILHYRIKDIFNYTYKQEKPEELLDNVTHQIITKIFAGKTFYAIATTYREKIEELTRNSLQREMDKLETGLEVLNVNTKDIHPPVSIADSFEEVIAALQEKEEKINQAIGYRNSALPEARGEAYRSEARAQAYIDRLINTASGEAGRFIFMHRVFQPFFGLARQFWYLRTMQEALADKRLILIDPEAGVPEIWIKRDELPQLFEE